MKKDCWWNENATSGKDTASLENPGTPAADAAATSVCQQSLVDSLGGVPRGPGVELRSATGHHDDRQHDDLHAYARWYLNVARDFQIAPKDTGLQRSIISVGQVRERRNIFTFRTILNEFTGNRIEFERVGGVYRLKADASAKTYSGKNGVKMRMGFEQDDADTAEAQLARSGNVPVLPSEALVEQHELTHFPFRDWCRHCVRATSKEARTMTQVWAACRSSPQTTCLWVRTER